MCDDDSNDTFDTTPVPDPETDLTYFDEIMSTDNTVSDPLVWIDKSEYDPKDDDND